MPYQSLQEGQILTQAQLDELRQQNGLDNAQGIRGSPFASPYGNRKMSETEQNEARQNSTGLLFQRTGPTDQGQGAGDATSKVDAGYYTSYRPQDDGSYQVTDPARWVGSRQQDLVNSDHFNPGTAIGMAILAAGGQGLYSGLTGAGAAGTGAGAATSAANAGGSLASEWAAMGANGVPTLTIGGEAAAAGGGFLGGDNVAQGFKGTINGNAPGFNWNPLGTSTNLRGGATSTGLTANIPGLASVTNGVITPEILAQYGVGATALVPGAVANSTTALNGLNSTLGDVTNLADGHPNKWTDPKNIKRGLDLAKTLFGDTPQGGSSGSGSGFMPSQQAQPAYSKGLLDIGGRIEPKELPYLQPYVSGMMRDLGQGVYKAKQDDPYSRGLMQAR